MLIIGMALAVVAGLQGRPMDVTGPDPQAYGHWLAENVLKLNDGSIGQPCPNAVMTSIQGLYGGPPPPAIAPPPGEQVSPVTYLERVKVEGCGHARIANEWVFPLKSGRWMVIGLLDGETLTSPLLEVDAYQTARPALALNAPCGLARGLAELKSGSVRVLAPREGNGPWTELWPATVCGKAVAVEIRFTPEADGGASFSMHRNDSASQDAPAPNP